MITGEILQFQNISSDLNILFFKFLDMNILNIRRSVFSEINDYLDLISWRWPLFTTMIDVNSIMLLRFDRFYLDAFITRLSVFAEAGLIFLFTRSAMLLLMCWESAGCFTAQTWQRVTVVNTEDTRGAFWKPSECELLYGKGIPSGCVRVCKWDGGVVPYLCILWAINFTSTCSTTELQFLVANLDY